MYNEIIQGLIEFTKWMLAIAKWSLISAFVCSILAILACGIIISLSNKAKFEAVKITRRI